MSITLSPGTPQAVGPGYVLAWQISAGPVPVDDYVTVSVDRREPFPARLLCVGSSSTFGFLSGTLQLGVEQIFRSFWIGNVFTQPAAGDLVDLRVEQYHADNTLVQSTTYNTGAWTWDPSGFLWLLQCFIAGQIRAVTDPNIAAVLAAVQQIYSTQP